MTEKRFTLEEFGDRCVAHDNGMPMNARQVVEFLNAYEDENEQLKKELERCKDWINSDKNDYELTLAFIKNKGYSLKDVLEYEKGL